jgi:hypothetical protein
VPYEVEGDTTALPPIGVSDETLEEARERELRELLGDELYERLYGDYRHRETSPPLTPIQVFILNNPSTLPAFNLKGQPVSNPSAPASYPNASPSPNGSPGTSSPNASPSRGSTHPSRDPILLVPDPNAPPAGTSTPRYIKLRQ